MAQTITAYLKKNKNKIKKKNKKHLLYKFVVSRLPSQNKALLRAKLPFN